MIAGTKSVCRYIRNNLGNIKALKRNDTYIYCNNIVFGDFINETDINIKGKVISLNDPESLPKILELYKMFLC